MRKVDLLYELQGLDTALDRGRETLEQCRVRLGDDSKLVPLREERDGAGLRLRSLQERGRELDWELETATQKLKGNEKKLYGGTIKNPKELAGLAHEVEHDRERISRLEDQVLMNMDSLDSASTAVQSAERAYAEQEAAWKAEQEALQTQCDSLAHEVDDLTGRRETVASRIDPDTLRVYESLRRTRSGLAVAVIEQRACRGCRISLSSSEVQRARSSSDLVICQSCGRILYLPL